MRLLLTVAVAVLAAAPVALADPGPDHVSSADLELLTSSRLPGSGMGGSLVGDRLFISGPGQLTVFDVSDAESPQLLGTTALEAANETEAVATNGRWAAVVTPTCSGEAPAGCLQIFDVSQPGAMSRIAVLAVEAQAAACVLDCRYLWVTGAGVILDMADPAHPKQVGEFLDRVPDGTLGQGCYMAREIRPGLVFASCHPNLVLSTLAEHGGSPTAPALLATAKTPESEPRLIGGAPHSAHWPRGGTDRFALTSEETPFQPECSDQLGALTLWDARPVLAGAKRFEMITQWRPGNGTYIDGRSPYNAVGCSPHFLAEHPSFRDGGLVAQAALENGLRLLQVTTDGKLEERAFFLGAGGAAAVPVWHPSGKVLYLVDYFRGLDVLRYTGPDLVPAVSPSSAPAPVVAPARPERLALKAARFAGRRVVVDVAVPRAGRLTLRARGLHSARVVVAAPRVVRVGLRLRGRPRPRITLRLTATLRAGERRLTLRATRRLRRR